MRPFRLFVYGTLRPGGVHHGLLATARRLGTWTTPPRYTLYALDHYPVAVPSGRTAVVGEVYAVDARTLARIDRLEDHPRTYRRMQLQTPWGPAWMYIQQRPPRGARLIASGDWLRR